MHEQHTYLNNCKIHCLVNEAKYSAELVVSSYPASVLQNSDAGWNKIFALSFILTHNDNVDLHTWLIITKFYHSKWFSSFRYFTCGAVKALLPVINEIWKD